MEEMMNQKIPETDSIEALARLWDTHDLTDFEDQLETVTEPIFQREFGQDSQDCQDSQNSWGGPSYLIVLFQC